MDAPKFSEIPLAVLLRRALHLYGETVVPAVPIALAMNLPLLIISALPMDAGEGGPTELSLVLILVLICSGIAVSSITRVLLGAAVDVHVTIRMALSLTFRRSLVTMILAFAITSFLSNLGLVALVLPGLLVGGLFAVALPAVLVERRSAFSALARSVTLMRMDLFKSMAAFSFGALISELLPLGIMLLLQSAVGPSPFSPLLAILINGITLPIALAVAVALYEGARLSEGGEPQAVRREVMKAVQGDASDTT